MHSRLSHQELVTICVFKCITSTSGNSVKRIVCHMECDIDFVGKSLGKTSEERAAAGEMDTVFYDV